MNSIISVILSESQLKLVVD